MELEGHVALVTGANRGIGAALVAALVEAGARRVYAGMRNPGGAFAGHPVVVPIALDVTNPAEVAAAARACGDVQVLVNNAGIALAQPLIGTADPEAAEREMRVNFFGTLAMSRAFAPVLARHGGGAIVNILSVLSLVSSPRMGSYSASKAAAWSLTQGIRGELAGQRTLVVGVLPGYVDTDMAKGFAVPKLSPAAVAASVVDALRSGTEDVFPGDAAHVASELRRDPKAMEKRFAQPPVAR